MQRFTKVIFMAVAAFAVLAPAAQAHVTAQPPTLSADSFSVVTFRVPNERDEPTVKLEVQFPDSLDSLSVKPVPGWTYKVTKEKLDEPRELHGSEITEYTSKVEWSGGEIKAGEYMEFPVSVKLPKKGNHGDDHMTFPALQTYEGGEVVRWVQTPEEEDGSFDELDEPAPHLELTAASGAHGGGGDGDKAKGDDEAGSGSEAASEDDLSTVRTIAFLGLVLGALGLILALLGVRGRSKENRA